MSVSQNNDSKDKENQWDNNQMIPAYYLEKVSKLQHRDGEHKQK